MFSENFYSHRHDCTEGARVCLGSEGGFLGRPEGEGEGHPECPSLWAPTSIPHPHTPTHMQKGFHLPFTRRMNDGTSSDDVNCSLYHCRYYGTRVIE